MGMYDTVKVACPFCHKDNDFQSKGGDCTLTDFTLQTAPLPVLADLVGQCPTECSSCGRKFAVRARWVAFCIGG